MAALMEDLYNIVYKTDRFAYEKKNNLSSKQLIPNKLTFLFNLGTPAAKQSQNREIIYSKYIFFRFFSMLIFLPPLSSRKKTQNNED